MNTVVIPRGRPYTHYWQIMSERQVDVALARGGHSSRGGGWSLMSGCTIIAGLTARAGGLGRVSGGGIYPA